MTVFLEGGLARHIHARFDGTIDKRLLSPFTGFHDGRHGAGAEDHRQKSRGKRTPAVEEDADQHREACHRQPDDRDMVDGKVQMGWGE